MTKEEKAEKQREYIRDYMRERRKDPVFQEWRREYDRERRNNPVFLERRRERDRELRKDPVVHERLKKRNRDWRNDPVVKDRLVEYERNRRQDPVFLERRREYDRAYGGDHFYRAIKRGNHAERFRRVDIFIRDGYVCAYCGKELDIKTATLDHIVPISKGGAHTPENCTTACFKCNATKAAKILPGIMVPTSDN